MKSLLIILTVNFLFLDFLSAQKRNSRNLHDSSEEHLFPGTGFFIKNRKPYEDYQAKAWFKEAYLLEKEEKTSKALSLYEKFTKRRSDAILKIDAKTYKVAPESLFRAATIREARGDWSKSFDHLKLIAQAYTDYDFELVADSLMRISERLAKEKLPYRWGIIPRFRSGNQDRSRFNEISSLTKGPKHAPRALMVLAEISIKDNKEEEAVDALIRLVDLYPDHYLSEKAYFLIAQVYENMVAGPAYDQGATMKSLNFYEDYLILYENAPERDIHETDEKYDARIKDYGLRKKNAELGRIRMRETLASSKLEIGSYLENYGKYFITRWRDLGDEPSLQFYNEAITVAPESEAARIAEKKILNLKNGE